MKASLIIYIKNNVAILPLLFEALNQQSERDFEVIFAHDGCDIDVEAAIVEIKKSISFPITYVSNREGGYKREAMLNSAIKEAKSDYLIFIGNNAIPHNKFVEEHIRLSAYGKAVAARKISLTKELSSHITPQLIASKKLHTYILRKLYSGVEAVSRSEAFRLTNGFLRHFVLDDVWQGLLTDNFSLYKEDLLSVNGFDERFDVKSEESDFELELRLMQKGVFTKEERRIATLYELWSEEQNEVSPLSASILSETNDKNLSWTSYGIVKCEEPVEEEE